MPVNQRLQQARECARWGERERERRERERREREERDRERERKKEREERKREIRESRERDRSVNHCHSKFPERVGLYHIKKRTNL
jgi:hypothetical protein